jgi:PAS domain S-box-containing protein
MSEQATGDTVRGLEAVTDQALAGLALDELLAELLDRMRDVLAASTAAILLIEGNTLVVRAARGFERGTRLPLSGSFAGHVAAGRHPVVVDSVSRAALNDPILHAMNARSLVGVPIVFEGQPIGALLVGSLRHRRFRPADAKLLQVVADRVGLGIAYARLYEQERRARADAWASEERLRQLADAMPQMVWTAGPDGAVDFYNRRWFEYTGLSLAASLGWGWQPSLHPDDLPVVMAAWEEGRRAAAPVTVEARFKRADGIYRWHLARAVAVTDEAGRVLRWIGTSTDIDEQKRAELALRASEARWAFLAQASTTLASSLDYEQTLRTLTALTVPFLADWCSVDILESDGTPRRVAIAHADPGHAEIAARASVYPPDPEGRHPRTQVLRTGRSVLIPDVTESALAGITADGDHRRALQQLGYRSAMIVALTARGQTLGAITLATTGSGRRYGSEDLAFAEDLAHRAALAVDNARLYREAQEANRLKDDFLTTVSHELRTPLASMMNWVAVLRQGKVGPDRITHALEVLQRSGQAQAKLIDDILDMSRSVTGRLRLELAPLDLAGVVTQALEAVRPAAEARKLAVEATLDPAAGPIVGDFHRLQQVVWNLLANAVKFTPEGGAVRVRLDRGSGVVRVVVADTGEGIASEFLPFVFERFRQADQTQARRHSGLGLGLAIVKHLVEAHGGRVTASSEGQGRGSTFIVTLPVAIEQAEVAGARDQAAHPHRRG